MTDFQMLIIWRTSIYLIADVQHSVFDWVANCHRGVANAITYSYKRIFAVPNRTQRVIYCERITAGYCTIAHITEYQRHGSEMFLHNLPQENMILFNSSYMIYEHIQSIKGFHYLLKNEESSRVDVVINSPSFHLHSNRTLLCSVVIVRQTVYCI